MSSRPLPFAFLALACALSPAGLRAEDKPAAVAAPAPVAETKAPAEKPYPEFGSKAPELKPSAWLQGGAVTPDDPSKLYLIACWSSLSAPAVKAIPILNDFHRRYSAKGAVVVGVSVWEESSSRVTDFLKGRGDALAFRVAFDGRDNGGTVSKRWLEDGQLNGIPYLFAVKGGRVLWHGTPDELDDKAIESMLSGSYDIAKAVAERAAEQAARDKAEPIASAIEDLITEKKFAEALAKCDELEKLLPPRDRSMANMLRAETLFEKGDFKPGFAQTKLYVDAHPNEPEVLAMTALSLVAEPRFEGNRDFALATSCIDRALAIAPIDAYRLLKARIAYTAGDFPGTDKLLAELKTTQNALVHAQLRVVLEAVEKKQPWPVPHKQDCACGAH